LASVDIRTVLVFLWGPTSLGGFRNDTSKAADAHVTLTVASEGVLSGEASTTGASKRLVSTVCLQVTLEIMATNKVLFTNVALELTVSQMCLHVGLDVFFATKSTEAVSEKTYPFAIFGIRTGNEFSDLVG
jgi:hypothetical protein